MPDQPLQPFHPPTFVSLPLQSFVTPNSLIHLVLWVVGGYWVIYTLAAIYHWLKFANSIVGGVVAIALHLAVSYALVIYAFTGTLPRLPL